MPLICPHCHKPTNEKYRQCVHCGGYVAKPPPPDTVPICPVCACQLQGEEYRGSAIDQCPKCQGLWLDTDEFAFHTSERDIYNDPAIPRTFNKMPLEVKRPYRPCVRCGSLMGRLNFRKISGVIVDICKDHGVWLDAGELEQIRSFIANGGLEESQDHEITANRLEISQTASQVKDLNTLFRTLNKFNLKRILLQGF